MTSTSKPLTILYRDEWLVAVDKPAGHLVHPADQPKDDDLVTMKILRDQIGQRVYTIHRIDRPTTGVLLFWHRCRTLPSIAPCTGTSRDSQNLLGCLPWRGPGRSMGMLRAQSKRGALTNTRCPHQLPAV